MASGNHKVEFVKIPVKQLQLKQPKQQALLPMTAPQWDKRYSQ
jgi:hypothetical protein